MTRGAANGNDRQALPEANLITATMESLQETVNAQDCTERLVNGKMLELKGQMLQAGVCRCHVDDGRAHELCGVHTAKLKKSGEIPASKAMAYPSKAPPMAPPKSPPLAPTPESQGADATMSLSSYEMLAENKKLQEQLKQAAEAVQVANLAAAGAMRQNLEAASRDGEVEEGCS